MNSPSSNSGGFADPVPPPPPVEFFIVLPDGSCIPATRDKLKIVLKQARTAELKKRKAAAREKADELQRNLEDRAAARRLLQELAEIDREHRRTPAILRARVQKERSDRQTSAVRKRVETMSRRSGGMPTTLASSWVIDDRGMRGVHYSQTYIGRKSPGFYVGAARDRWEYEARDEAVLRGPDGNPIIITNLGDDVDEIAAAWQAIEDATTRANGKIQIRIIVALDADASTEEQVAGMRHFCETVLSPLGLAYSGVIHRPPDTGDERNVHGHILTNFRPTQRVAPYNWAFSDHVRGELDGKNGVQMLRHLWAHSMSEAAEKSGRNMRYTGLGYGGRGLGLEPGEHLGEAKSAMVARGQRVWAWERNRIKNARNAARREIRDADVKIAALSKVRDAAIAQMNAEQRVEPARSIVSAELLSPPQEPLRVAMPPGVRAKRIASASVVITRPRLESARSVQPVRPARASSNTPIDEHMILRTSASASIERAPRRVASTQVGTAPVKRKPAVAGTKVSSASLGRFRAGVPTDQSPATLSSAAVPVEHPRHRVAATRTATPVRVFRAALSIDPPDSATRVSASRSVARKAPEPRLASAETNSVADPVISQAMEMLQAIRLNQSRVATRKAKVRARWREAETAHRGRETIADVPTLADMPTREWLEAHPRTGYVVRQDEDATDRTLLAQVARIDPYVADLHDGTFDIDYRVLHAIGVDADWLKRPRVQRGLADIRTEQQQVVAKLTDEADRRPLDFARHGKRFWPRDLVPAALVRLDRWAADDSFQTDMMPIESTVRAAHEARDRQSAAPTLARPTPNDAAPNTPAAPIPDGFGGMRKTPPPPYCCKATAIRQHHQPSKQTAADVAAPLRRASAHGRICQRRAIDGGWGYPGGRRAALSPVAT